MEFWSRVPLNVVIAIGNHFKMRAHKCKLKFVQMFIYFFFGIDKDKNTNKSLN